MAFCSACQIEVASGKFCTTCGRQLVDKSVPDDDQSLPAGVGGNNNLAMWAHLAPLLAGTLGIFLGVTAFLLWLPGLLIRNSAKTDFERRHATESLNFQLSLLVYAGASIIFGIVTIGIGLLLIVPLAVGAGIAAIIFMIMGTLAATNGKDYRYPLTIRFIK